MPDPLTIAAGAWAWDKYGKSLTDKAVRLARDSAVGLAEDVWKKFKWKDAAADYRTKINKLYGTMQIMGMAKPVPLDDIFTNVYMLDKPTAFGRFDIERLKKLSADPDAPPPQAERINGLRLVVEKGNLFILGKPGAGKTTFLRYIAIKAAERTIDKVPIFVSLKEWADSGKELMPFIAERFDVCGFPDAQLFIEELLKSSSAIVLFDGLDEVTQERGHRDKQIRAINNFVEKYDRAQCLITCRIAASDYSFNPFAYVEIADFTEKEIKEFVGNWFRKEGKKDEDTCRRFLTEFAKDDNRGVRDLARKPLLLTLLCLAFDETQTFPQRRAEIYKEALDALLKKWDSSRRIKRDEVYRKLSLGHKENMLARIAAETFEKNQYFIPQAALERLITNYVKNIPPHDVNETADGEAILKAIEMQHGILVERAREVYSFSHLTFQEYFTVKYIVSNAAQDTLINLVKAHCTDKRWREVLLLTASLLPDASKFMIAFRHGIDKLPEENETLKDLLTWANKKAASIQPDAWLARQNYLFLELYSERMPYNLARVNEERALTSALEDYVLHLDPLFLNTVLDLDLKLSCILARVRPRTKILNIAHELSLFHGRILTLPSALARDLGLDDLANELSALSVPTDKASAAEWGEFADKLSDLIMEYRNIGHDWKLTEPQKSRLADYLNANGLLRDCLELAFMSPDEKKSMLNSLYLPPSRVEDGRDA